MEIVVIDGQGGGVGKALIEQIKAACPEARVIAVGTNAMATANMLRAGAAVGATGENAVCVNCRTADVICGPIGIVLADAMYGEMTAVMAVAVAASSARRVLIPVSKCRTYVAGTQSLPLSAYVADAAEKIRRLYAGEEDQVR
ncbi:MAG: DUF3842 family protein [Eubacteriales bacterium]|nr:DUF3842 family protein [Eubacteriales bacterium]